MRTRDPFGEVLVDLRHRIRRGDIAPGAPLIVMDLAADLGVSATPVREALAYLAGEGLVEGRLGPLRGYLVTRPGPAELTDLLRSHQAQVLLVLADAAARTTGDGAVGVREVSETARVARTEGVFAALIARGGGGVLQRAHRLVADRLHLVRLHEAAVLDDLDAELADLEVAVSGQGAAGAVRAYHRRRLAAVVRLAALSG